MRIGQPVGAIGDIGQRAHPGEARRQRVNVAVGPVEARELALHPVFRQAPVALRQMLEHRADEARVFVLGGFTKIRRLADFPKPHQIRPVARAPDDHLIGRKLAQRRFILALLREPESPRGRRRGQRSHEALQRLKIEPMVAPFRRHYGWKDMPFDRCDDVRIEIRRFARHAERAVPAKAAGAPGDLGDLLRMEAAQAPAVKLA